MRKNKTKYLVIGVIMVILISASFIGINLLKSKPKEEKGKTISREETKSMLSYTLDGEKTDIKPTKESGYIANKIICENGSNLIWDNTNWEVEIIKLESNDICSVDFTTNTSTSGYRVTATTNVEGSIDSLSKATIENGTIIFYPNNGQQITSVSGCSNGKLENNKVIVSNVTSNQTCNIEVKKPTLRNKILSDKTTILTRTDFSSVLSNDNSKTIYKESGNFTEDIDNDGNGELVYYFAGNPNDNWVSFGNYMWRIIRINEDDSIRLLYHGTSTTIENAYIGSNQAYNNNYDDAMYVGYMYGSKGDLESNRENGVTSSIKDTIDRWYNSNMKNIYERFISKTAIYCNDRATEMYDSNNLMWYAAVDRVRSEIRPSFRCGNNQKGNLFNNANVADKFSASQTYGGNGKLIYPVALMTADEIIFAGGKPGTPNASPYYALNSLGKSSTGILYWWTMTPYANDSISSTVYEVYGSGNLGALNQTRVNSNSNNTIRPVLSLKSCVTWKAGDGTANNPYEVEIDDSCAIAEN